MKRFQLEFLRSSLTKMSSSEPSFCSVRLSWWLVMARFSDSWSFWKTNRDWSWRSLTLIADFLWGTGARSSGCGGRGGTRSAGVNNPESRLLFSHGLVALWPSRLQWSVAERGACDFLQAAAGRLAGFPLHAWLSPQIITNNVLLSGRRGQFLQGQPKHFWGP